MHDTFDDIRHVRRSDSYNGNGDENDDYIIVIMMMVVGVVNVGESKCPRAHCCHHYHCHGPFELHSPLQLKPSFLPFPAAA